MGSSGLGVETRVLRAMTEISASPHGLVSESQNSMYARGAEMLGGSYYFLDMTALGRQEDWGEQSALAGSSLPTAEPPGGRS
jgi:predicted dithiol-disulfide oxidoreductase (DUF899 family)